MRNQEPELSEIPAVVLSAFDRSTRLLPFVFYDSHMFPSGAVTIAGARRATGGSQKQGSVGLWTKADSLTDRLSGAGRSDRKSA